MHRDVDRRIQRTRRYWYEDGLTEIAIGCLLAAVGLAFLAELLAPPGPLSASLSAFLLPVVVIGGGWIARRVVAVLKERITYPRTGYVAYQRRARSRGQRIATAIVGALLGALMAMLIGLWPTSRTWVSALQGLLGGVVFLYIGHQLGIVRFYALALLSALFGVGATLSGLDTTAGSAVYFGATGLALIASGSITLRLYLQQTGPPMEE